MSTGTSSNCCDRCGRSLDGKGFIENMGMKICGICEVEIKAGGETNYGQDTPIIRQHWDMDQRFFEPK